MPAVLSASDILTLFNDPTDYKERRGNFIHMLTVYGVLPDNVNDGTSAYTEPVVYALRAAFSDDMFDQPDAQETFAVDTTVSNATAEAVVDAALAAGWHTV